MTWRCASHTHAGTGATPCAAMADLLGRLDTMVASLAASDMRVHPKLTSADALTTAAAYILSAARLEELP